MKYADPNIPDFETIVQRIQKLWTLAHDAGATEGEENAAALHAQKLMAKYSVTEEDLSAKRTARQDQSIFDTPKYVEIAAEEYRSSSETTATATIVLAFATVRYFSEILQGWRGQIPSGMTAAKIKRLVTQAIVKKIGDASLASRLFGITRLAARLKRINIALEDLALRSQGVLFALLTAAKGKSDEELGELVHAATTMTISEFRDKYIKPRCKSGKPKHRKAAETSETGIPTLEDVLNWVQSAGIEDVQAVKETIEARLEQKMAAA